MCSHDNIDEIYQPRTASGAVRGERWSEMQGIDEVGTDETGQRYLSSLALAFFGLVSGAAMRGNKVRMRSIPAICTK